jgi:hypothetical protein
MASPERVKTLRIYMTYCPREALTLHLPDPIFPPTGSIKDSVIPRATQLVFCPARIRVILH